MHSLALSPFFLAAALSVCTHKCGVCENLCGCLSMYCAAQQVLQQQQQCNPCCCWAAARDPFVGPPVYVYECADTYTHCVLVPVYRTAAAAAVCSVWAVLPLCRQRPHSLGAHLLQHNSLWVWVCVLLSVWVLASLLACFSAGYACWLPRSLSAVSVTGMPPPCPCEQPNSHLVRVVRCQARGSHLGAVRALTCTL